MQPTNTPVSVQAHLWLTHCLPGAAQVRPGTLQHACPRCPPLPLSFGAAGALQKAPKRAAIKAAHKEAMELTKASRGALSISTVNAAQAALGGARYCLPLPLVPANGNRCVPAARQPSPAVVCRCRSGGRERKLVCQRRPTSALSSCQAINADNEEHFAAQAASQPGGKLSVVSLLPFGPWM